MKLLSWGRRSTAAGSVRPLWRRALKWALIAAAAPHVLLLVYAVLPPPITPLMVLRLAQGEGLDKDWVGLGEIQPYLAYAVIAAEDNRFCHHGGVDWEELTEQIERYQAGEEVRGASTITMQTVKNLILWPGRDTLRKGIEIYFAHYLDLIWSKRRIMEVYLNIVEWDNGVYGAEAASRHHFKRQAGDLTPGQAALLAATLPNPREWSAGRPGPYVSSRSRIIARRVEQLGSYLDCVRPH
ncbi:MAG: monofunctional biosynthetic peptidoglycan transglycosylase [Reyranellaceae bacterium]